jgi:hypothetical protein
MKPNFESLLQQATLAANEAGDKWVNEHPRGDVCGFGFIELRDNRTRFSKWLKVRQNGYTTSVQLNHKYRGRQEWGLNEACARAGLAVLRDAGIKGLTLYSRID